VPTANSLAQNLKHARRLVPVPLVPLVARRRADKLWANDAFRARQIESMEFLLGESSRADEVPELAYAYTEQMVLREHLRWHPRAISRQRVDGIEWLTTRRDPQRGVIISFTHHHRYDGLFPSLAQLGLTTKMVINPEIAKPEAGIELAQHLRVAGRGGVFVTTEGGTSALAAHLEPGTNLGLAIDFPGRTPVTFLGRSVLGSFGTPALAVRTNTPVVMATHRRDADGPYVRLDPPLEPSDYPDPSKLLDDLLQRHGEAILDWPEALESPQARFGRIENE
jgi:lauroyl/myristoyl acyltransferase